MEFNIPIKDKQGRVINNAFMFLKDGIEYLQCDGYVVANIDEKFNIAIDEDWNGGDLCYNIFLNLTDDEIRDKISKGLITLSNLYELDI